MICLFLMSSGTATESGKPHNGYWWEEMGGMEKLGYVQGYADGIMHAAALVNQTLGIHKMKLDAGFSEESVTSYMDFAEVSYGQYLEGLDTFYKDYRNKRIKTVYAILYVRDQVRGASQADLDKRAENMRKGAASPDYDDAN